MSTRPDVLRGAATIGVAMLCSKSRVYSWAECGDGPIPIYKDPLGRLWARQEDVDAFWNRSRCVSRPAREDVEAATDEEVARVAGA